MTDATPERCPALKDGFAWYEKLLARGLLAAMIGVGAVGTWIASPGAAVGYLAFAAVGGLLVVYDLLCVYCPYPYQRADCLFFPYPLLSRVLPQRTGAIGPVRKLLLVVVAAGLVLIPQYWLWGNWPLLAAFWLLTVPFGLAFPLYMCRRCRHVRCPANATMSVRNVMLAVAAVLVGTGMAAAADQSGTPTAPGVVAVGAARIDITPETPVRMYGYGARKTESEGIAGRLLAKALAVGGDAGEGPAVLLCVDCGAVPVRVRDEVFRRVSGKVKIRPERFVLANAHVHSGPDVAGYERLPAEHKEHVGRYMKRLTDCLEQVVLEALRSRRPGRLAWARGKVGFAANRRVLKEGKWAGFGAVPGAPVDHTLLLLRATDTGGKLVAVLANYACHCTTLRGNFTRIHGDWAGSAQRFLEADHPDAVAMITIGCGADADPCPHGTVELCDRHGRALAGEVKRLLAGPMTPIEPKLTARRVTLKLAYQDPPDTEDLEKRAKSSWSLQQVLQRRKRGEPIPPLEYPIVTWVFDDDLAMVFLTGEVVVDYARRMGRELDGRRLWITAYAHEVPCYVVSQRILREGGYEAKNSISARISFGRPETVKPPMEDRIIAAVRGLLPEPFRAPGGAGLPRQ